MCAYTLKIFVGSMINPTCVVFQVYWLGPLLGGGLGAVVYDRIFSTKVCKTRLGSCMGGAPQARQEQTITVGETENSIHLLDSGQDT